MNKKLALVLLGVFLLIASAMASSAARRAEIADQIESEMDADMEMEMDAETANNNPEIATIGSLFIREAKFERNYLNFPTFTARYRALDRAVYNYAEDFDLNQCFGVDVKNGFRIFPHTLATFKDKAFHLNTYFIHDAKAARTSKGHRVTVVPDDNGSTFMRLYINGNLVSSQRVWPNDFLRINRRTGKLFCATNPFVSGDSTAN